MVQLKRFTSLWGGRDGAPDFRVLSSNVLKEEKEEAEAVLTVFLKNETGLNDEAAAAMVSKSVPFIDHLVARFLYSQNTVPSRLAIILLLAIPTEIPFFSQLFKFLVAGRELITLEIRDAIIPYLEYLCEEHGGSLDDVMENFRNPPKEEQKRHMSETSPTNLPLHSKKLKAMARMTEIGTDGQLHPNTLYLIDIGLDMDQIKEMARKWPSITHAKLQRKIKPLVEFLLNLGMPLSNISNILYKAPRLCSLSLSEDLIHSMAYLETLGLDNSKWSKVIYNCPHLLIRSRQKVEATVDFLYELGLSGDRLGKVLTRFPQITTCSINDKLRPIAEYFRSMGLNFESLLGPYPQVLGLSIESNLKPRTEFFLDKGYSIDEIGRMASRSGSIYTLSLTKNVIPKWDFFLTMDYPRSELVKYPHYFGYSLEGRIKPRYAQMREYGVKSSLSYVFGSSDSKFEKFLNKNMKKSLVAEHDSINVTSDNDRK